MPQGREDLSDLEEQVRIWSLTEFVSNEDLQVRRRLISRLRLNPQIYPPEYRPLIPTAIQIARSHTDAYIRHRIEIQLGGGGPYMPVPHE
jgi:hypothetical protein